MSSGWCGWVHISCKVQFSYFCLLCTASFPCFLSYCPFFMSLIFMFLGGSWKNTGEYLVNDLTDLKTGLIGFRTLFKLTIGMAR